MKRTRKQARASRKLPGTTANAGSGIRGAEEARALLEDQLHSLYWWVFNAFKMKGFIRAKALGELKRAKAHGEKGHSGQDADRAIPSSPK
jgi:hypothetical protein